MSEIEFTEEQIQQTYQKLKKDAQAGGYHLNHDMEFVKELIRGLLTNKKRYGYWSCPCRLASGMKEEDLDIICPCDYRDVDLNEHGSCYCALYVSQEVLDAEREIGSIPERRPPLEERKKVKTQIKGPAEGIGSPPLPVWRCKVCGYLCAREGPPEVCPICKAKKERFEKFI